eukprot:279088-Amphidinium_carterae.2
MHGDLVHVGPGLGNHLWPLVLGAVIEVSGIPTVTPLYYPITDGRNIKRFMSDKGRDISECNVEVLQQLGLTLTTALSYQPQSNGMAERCVGLMNTAARRLLLSAGLSHVVRWVGCSRSTTCLDPNVYLLQQDWNRFPCWRDVLTTRKNTRSMLLRAAPCTCCTSMSDSIPSAAEEDGSAAIAREGVECA